MQEQHMRDVVIVAATRTPIGKGNLEKGVYRDEHPVALLAGVYTALIEQAGVDPALVDDAIAGCGQPYGVQSSNVARNAWLHAGLPVTTPASTVDLPVARRSRPPTSRPWRSPPVRATSSSVPGSSTWGGSRSRRASRSSRRGDAVHGAAP